MFHSVRVPLSLKFFLIIWTFMFLKVTLGRPYETTAEILAEIINATIEEEFDELFSVVEKKNSTNKRIVHPHKGMKESSQDIVFPDSFEMLHDLREAVTRLETTPECAKDGSGTFCEDIPTYPHKLVKDLLGKLKNRADYFGAEETPEEIAERIGAPEESFICRSVDKIIYPKVGKTKSQKWKYIINEGHKDGHVQAVRGEMCTSSGKPCDLLGREANGFITSCKQKYTYRRLLSLSESGEAIQDTFIMPSACCCSYRRDFGFLARFGSSGTTPIR